jgi:hypothetical protein
MEKAGGKSKTFERRLQRHINGVMFEPVDSAIVTLSRVLNGELVGGGSRDCVFLFDPSTRVLSIRADDAVVSSES